MVALYFHCLLVYILKQKKSLKRLALKQKSETNLPFTNKGGEGGGDCCNLFIIKKPV